MTLPLTEPAPIGIAVHTPRQLEQLIAMIEQAGRTFSVVKMRGSEWWVCVNPMAGWRAE